MNPFLSFLIACLSLAFSGCASLGFTPQSRASFVGQSQEGLVCRAEVEGFKTKGLIKLACTNTGTVPIETNQVYDEILFTSGDRILKASNDPTSGVPAGYSAETLGLFYRSTVINPGSSVALATLNIWDPSIRALIEGGSIDRIIFRVFVSRTAVEMFPE